MKASPVQIPRLWRPTAALVLIGVCPLAHASVDIVLRLDTSWGQNSNVFRNDASLTNTSDITANLPPPTGETASATQTHGVALTVGVPLGSPDTRLVLSSTLAAQRFGTVFELNHIAQIHAMRLPWRYSELWDGEVSVGNAKAAYPVDDFYTRLDMVERRWVNALIRLKPTPYLALPLQITSTSAQYADRIAHGQLDQNVNSAAASLVYRSPLGNTVQVGVVSRQIAFPNRISSATPVTHEELEQDTFVDLLWVHSPRTQQSIRWGKRLKTAPDGQFAPSRQTLFRWAATHGISPYTRLEAQAWRQPYQNTDTETNYGTSKGHGLGVVWNPSHKLSVRAGWQRDSQRDLALLRTESNLSLNPTTRRTSIRAEYLLDRGFNAFWDASRETRVRQEGNKAHQTVWRVGVEYRYENLPGAAQRSQPAALSVP